MCPVYIMEMFYIILTSNDFDWLYYPHHHHLPFESKSTSHPHDLSFDLFIQLFFTTIASAWTMLLSSPPLPSIRIQKYLSPPWPFIFPLYLLFLLNMYSPVSDHGDGFSLQLRTPFKSPQWFLFYHDIFTTVTVHLNPKVHLTPMTFYLTSLFNWYVLTMVFPPHHDPLTQIPQSLPFDPDDQCL